MPREVTGFLKTKTPESLSAGPHAATTGAHGRPRAALRLGIGGPVGAGKTALIAGLCRSLSERYEIAVVLNDPTLSEMDALLRVSGLADANRIRAVRTGCSPHTAIREDISANLTAVEALEAAKTASGRSFASAPDLILVESGGGDLTTSFSRALVDRQIFVIDVAGGQQAPRKGGPGIRLADLLVVNKTDLAEYVGADLEAMRHDAAAHPTVFTSLTEHPGAPAVADWVSGLIDEHRVLRRMAA